LDLDQFIEEIDFVRLSSGIVRIAYFWYRCVTWSLFWIIETRTFGFTLIILIEYWWSYRHWIFDVEMIEMSCWSRMLHFLVMILIIV